AWIPLPLRTPFWATYVCFLVAGAIGLEIALHFSNEKQGWAARESSESDFMHYVYTLPAVGVAMIFVGLWAWTDIEVKRMQVASFPCLFQPTFFSNAIVWVSATYNKHYLVALTSLMALIALAFQPLAAALFTVRDTWRTLPSFLGASGFASSAIVYNLADPPFVRDGYSVASFNLPFNVANNGTVSANTTAIFSDPGCRDPDEHPDGSGWNNSATFNGCTFQWEVDKSSVHLFGAETMPPCDAFNGTDVAFAPVIFWFFTYQPKATASVTLCAPTITVQKVAVTVDLSSQNLTSVTPLSNITSGDPNFAQSAAGVLALNGQAYNGMNWSANQLVADPFVNARAQAIQLQLPAAVFQNAVQSPAGLNAAFLNNAFAPLSTTVYRTYLAMLARLLYFVASDEPVTVSVQTIKKRLWLSDVAVHLLAAGMLILAFFGAVIHVLHRYDRRDLHFQHQPGTLASAAAFTAQTPMASLLDGRQRKEDITSALQNRRFRIDLRTMKVVMEGEPGYDDARSPGWRKTSFGFGVPWFGKPASEEGAETKRPTTGTF
ncbi:hypothetical protein BV25DRAFT_1810416, partial [Artomyces pyxidatus]